MRPSSRTPSFSIATLVLRTTSKFFIVGIVVLWFVASNTMLTLSANLQSSASIQQQIQNDLSKETSLSGGSEPSSGPLVGATRDELLQRIRFLKCNNPLSSEVHALWNTLDSEPILNEKQAIWIVKTVRQSAPNPKFLVYGLGFDSSIWTDFNTCGRTVFVEELQAWINKVSERFPQLEIHNARYR